ncbi:MAG: hypothetical protein NTY09_05915 [bacterium]|nr:hypothetical protein [bacterium]
MTIQNSIPRNILKAIIIALGVMSLFFVSGCLNQTPEKVVEKFFAALYEGDSGSAQKFCTERALAQDLSTGDNAFTSLRDDHSSGDNNFVEDKLVSDIRGNTAEVWSRDDEDLRLILIKKGMSWVIDEFQIPTSTTRDRGANTDDEEADNTNNDNTDDNTDNTDDTTTHHRLRPGGD